MPSISRSPSVRGIRVRNGMSYNNIDSAAQMVVRRLVPGRIPGSQLPGIELFEHFTVEPGRFRVPVGRDQVIGLGGGVCPIPDGQHARTRYSNDERLLVVELSDETYDGLRRGEARCLFTLWHELGHAYLHTPELLDGEYIEHATHVLAREGGEHEIFRDSEWQADCFAAAALAPLKLLKTLKAAGRLSVGDLCEITGLSRESAAYRIDNAKRKQGL